jgi:hypothetical protein
MFINPHSIRLLDSENNEELEQYVRNKGTWIVDIDQGIVLFEPNDGYKGLVETRYVIRDLCNNVSAPTIITIGCGVDNPDICDECSNISSDSSDTLSIYSIIGLMLMTLLSGLYFVRKEEINKKGN